jgi:NADH-quinone oxidoreductase subunit J
VELVLIFASWVIAPAVQVSSPAPSVESATNTHALGRILYTDYVYVFEAAGMVLLVAMVGAIVLTLRAREGVRRQSAARQVHRSREQAVEIKKVQPGSGV